jgi:hypothetical protein
MEDEAEEEVFERFGVPALSDAVHRIDNALLMTEAEQVLPDGYWKDSPDYARMRKQFWAGLPVVIEPWGFEEARDRFLALFKRWKP